MADKLAYTVSEAAEAVGVHRATIYRLVKAGVPLSVLNSIFPRA